jgi:hypothetical protein
MDNLEQNKENAVVDTNQQETDNLTYETCPYCGSVVDANNLLPKRKRGYYSPLFLVGLGIVGGLIMLILSRRFSLHGGFISFFGLVELIGFIMAIVYRCSKVKLPDGRKAPRYDDHTRKKALQTMWIYIGLRGIVILIALAMFVLAN